MDWNRKAYKHSGRESIKRNYTKMIIICLVLMVVCGEFSGSREILTEMAQPLNSTQLEARLPNVISKSRTIYDFVNGVTKGVDNLNLIKGEVSHRISNYRPSRGILAQFFNSVSSSDDIATGVLNAFNTMVFKDHFGNGVVILVANILTFFILFFVGKVLSVGGRRYFLEARRYYNTGLERLFFIYRLNKTWNIVKVMLRTALYQMLWTITIVGGMIKAYSYYLVPFIVAENPGIKGKDAILLSRKLMDGYKWKVFIVDLSYVGWNILNIFSFGLIGIFFLNAYRTTVDTEIYITLRRRAKEAKMLHAELLCDALLDIDDISDKEYPMDQYFIQTPKKRSALHIEFDRKYSVLHLILIFFIFAFIGWCWEVSIHLVADGEFVKRGVLMGPYLPIYGFGGVMVLIILKPFRNNMIKTFFLTVLLCGTLEYVTSWYLEFRYHTKWWDYTGYLLNINGRVCLEGLLVFGVGACMMIYVLAPLLDALLSRIPNRIALTVAVVLLSLFAIDNIHAQKHPNMGRGITDYQSAEPQTHCHDINALP